jgi:hypothetical protein
MSQFEKILEFVPDNAVGKLAEYYAGLFDPPLVYNDKNEFCTRLHQLGFESFLVGLAVANKPHSEGVPTTHLGAKHYDKTAEEMRGVLHQIAEPGTDKNAQPCVPYQDLVKRVEKLEEDRIGLLERIVLHLTTPPTHINLHSL